MNYFTGNLCSDVHQPTNDIVKSTAAQPRMTSDQSNNQVRRHKKQAAYYKIANIIATVILLY